MNSNMTSGNQEHREHIKSHFCNVRCISWSAIVIGAIVAVSFSFLLNLFALAVGLSAFPTTSDGQTTFAVWGFVGLIVLAIIAMFPAGYVAGVLGRSHCMKRKMGELYGVAAWGLALILTIFLASSLSQFVRQSSYLVNRQAISIKVNNMNTDDVYKVDKTPQETTVQVNSEKATEAAGLATFATFFVFFIGFLAACFGGRCGMICKKQDPNCIHCHDKYNK